MGRIKSLMVKRAAKQLLAQDEQRYTSQFADNKKVLGSNMPSKPIRNKIAGYIARIVKMKAAAKNAPQVKAKTEEEPLQAEVM